MGVSIEHILETHNHADHVSGHGRLAAATGATIHVHREANPDYEHHAFDDGWELELGCVTIRALHTPGHRPEHTAFALIDTARGPEPWAVLSGDTLFVGDVARPDLAIEKSEGAREIYRSLHGQLLGLPDECEVWPGHLGRSMCGGPGMDMKISTTIGYERDHNPVLSITDEDEFVRQTLEQLGPQPPNFQAIVELNKGPLLTDGVELEHARREPALQILDVREEKEWSAGHIPGSMFTPWHDLSELPDGLDPRRPVAVICGSGQRAGTAASLARRLGVENVIHIVDGGVPKWGRLGFGLERSEVTSAAI